VRQLCCNRARLKLSLSILRHNAKILFVLFADIAWFCLLCSCMFFLLQILRGVVLCFRVTFFVERKVPDE